MDKNRILHILTSPRAEGTPRLVLDWLDKSNLEQGILFLNSEPADLLNLFQQKSSNIFIFNTKNTNYIRHKRTVTQTVYKVCKRYKPQYVICWNQGYSQWIILGARIAGVKKTIVHIGCEPEYDKSLRNLLFTYYMHWPLFLMKSQLVCASEFLKTKFFAMPLMPKSNIHRVYNCLQLNRFTPPYENRSVQNKIAIIVANLEPPKDHESLLMAWKKVVKKEPEAMLWVVGRGSLQKYLENICIQLNIKNNVIFFGQRDDVPQLLWQSKIFVFTSKSEGFGTVLLEALAAGLKIIAFDEPAAREVLNNGKWGQLIPNRDIELFANAIIKEFKNEHVTIDKEKINKYLENFSVDNMIQGYLNILKAD